jgi:hypothetical protein
VAANVLTAPNPHNGNIASEQVTITAQITDADAADTLSAEYTVDGGATWVAFAQTGVSPLSVSAVYSFPNGYTEGSHPIAVRGYDGTVNSANAAGAIVVTDTTDPVILENSVPASTIYNTQPANFNIGYGDFTTVNLALASSYLHIEVNNVSWPVNLAWTNASLLWGSYLHTLTILIPGSTFTIGDWVEYTGQFTDTAATPNNIAYAGGAFQVLAAPPGVQDPYPIYGYVQLYNGNAGVYTPITSTGGQLASVSWISSETGAVETRTDLVNAFGQFSVDLLNYTQGGQVWLTATFEAPYNNVGYNVTTVDIAGFPGGRIQNILCGIPYNVEITVPLAGAIEYPAVASLATYVWYDVNGVQCRGYYTFADGPMLWYSGDLLFVPPAAYNFNGIADQGTHNDNLVLFTGGNQWINISENGAAGINPYSTPWGAIQIPTTFGVGGAVYVDGFLKDWDNITVFVMSGGFDWNVVDGWNIVSVPQNVVNKGTNGVFDAYDALMYVAWQLNVTGGFTQLSLADRTGGNPSAYNMFDFGMAENVAFPMDGAHGYWVFSDGAAICHFNSTNYTFGAGDNILNAVAGWNLVGFTHNYTAWTVVPTAAMWADGTIDATLLASDKVVATEWLEAAAPQWYNSYVDITTFPGMATHNWIWDTAYSTQPGNGLFLWLEAPAVVTFDVEF